MSFWVRLRDEAVGSQHHQTSANPETARGAVISGGRELTVESSSELPKALWGRRIAAAVPERARFMLDRLTGIRVPFASLADLRAELDAAAGRPTEVGQLRRGIHLAIQGFFLSVGLALMLTLSSGWLPTELFPLDLAVVIAIPATWVVWAVATRGGLSLPLAGITLVNASGLPAGRRFCGLRALLVWALPTAMLAASRYVQVSIPRPRICRCRCGWRPLSSSWAICGALLFPSRACMIAWRARSWSPCDRRTDPAGQAPSERGPPRC